MLIINSSVNNETFRMKLEKKICYKNMIRDYDLTSIYGNLVELIMYRNLAWNDLFSKQEY